MSPVSVSDSEQPNLAWLYKRIAQSKEKAHAFIQNTDNTRLRDRWDLWAHHYDGLLLRCTQDVRVEISLVGGTGAGKSTLLNALIGVRLLPVSNMRACTSAITEVAFKPGDFKARIEFISREAWQHEIDCLLADFKDLQYSFDSDDVGNQRGDISRTVRDKLKAVYGLSDADFNAGSLPELHEPSEIRQCLDAGAIEFTRPSTEIDQFRKEVEKYLHSKHPYWPIVRTVSIHGPFETLSDGVAIVDLPGINDPNEAREEVTKQHLKTCRFVWIVFNIKRCLTKDTVALIQSEEFLRQIVMDGRADSLTFVGTAADDLDPESGREEFDLAEDADVTEIVSARNREVRAVVKQQLEDMAHRFVATTRASSDDARKLNDKLKSSQVYTVSAKEYFRLAGLSKSQAAGLSHVEQTEVPALRNHMTSICRSHGIAAHVESIQRQLKSLVQEIRSEVQSLEIAVKNEEELTERQRKGLGAAIKTAHSFLEQQLRDTAERLVQDLDAGKDILGERVKLAVERARAEMGKTLDKWEQIHWNTIRAVCRRGGCHIGSRKNDFPGDLAKPILDSIAFAWSDFFGEKLRLTLKKWMNLLKQRSTEFQKTLIDTAAQVAELSLNQSDNIAGIFATSERVLDEQLAQTLMAMETRITELQRNLYEVIPSQLRANLQPAFQKAEKEQGAGMKNRIMTILRDHAHSISTTMFDDAREAIQNGLRGLNDWLARQSVEMTGTVRRNADLAGENLVSSTALTGTLAQQKESLKRMLEWVADLEQHSLKLEAA